MLVQRHEGEGVCCRPLNEIGAKARFRGFKARGGLESHRMESRTGFVGTLAVLWRWRATIAFGREGQRIVNVARDNQVDSCA